MDDQIPNQPALQPQNGQNGIDPQTGPYEGTLNVRRDSPYPTMPQPIAPTQPVTNQPENLPRPYQPGQVPPQLPSEPLMGSAGRPLFAPDPITNQPNPARPRRRFSVKPLLTIFAAVLLLGGASAAAYFGVFVPNKPENQLMSSFQKTLQQQYITAAIKVDSEAKDEPAVKVEATVRGDRIAKRASAEVKATVKGASIPIEARLVDDNAYLKFGDLTNLLALFGDQLPAESAPLLKSLGKKLSNQWVEFDSTLLKDYKVSACPEALNFQKDDFVFMEKLYKQHSFIESIKKGTDNVAGKAAVKMDLVINDKAAEDFSMGLKDLPSIKKSEQCKISENASDTSKPAGDTEVEGSAAESPNTTTNLTVWIDKSSKLLSQLKTETTEDDATTTTTINLSYNKFTIEKPEKSIPFLNYLVDLKALFGADPGVLGATTDLLSPN